MSDTEDHNKIQSKNIIVKSISFDRISRSQSRSSSVETCVTKIDNLTESLTPTKKPNEEEMDVNEEDNAESDAKVISLKSVFSSGAITGIFSSTPICSVVGFEVKETMGNKEGLLGAFLGVAGGIISTIMFSVCHPKNKENQNKKHQVVELKEEDINGESQAEEIEDTENVQEIQAEEQATFEEHIEVKSPKTDDEESAKKTSHKTELTDDDIEFIMDNTDFNRDQVLRWFSAFKIQCPDCRLDRPNFINFYKNLIPGNSGVKDEFADAVFQAFDFDNNGYVDFGEFLIAFWIKAKGSIRNKLIWLFDVYDSDKSGFISMTELTHMLRLVFSLKNMNDDPVERAQYVMSLVDCNSDGQLSRLEFIEGCMMDDELRELLET